MALSSAYLKASPSLKYSSPVPWGYGSVILTSRTRGKRLRQFEQLAQGSLWQSRNLAVAHRHRRLTPEPADTPSSPRKREKRRNKSKAIKQRLESFGSPQHNLPRSNHHTVLAGSAFPFPSRLPCSIPTRAGSCPGQRLFTFPTASPGVSCRGAENRGKEARFCFLCSLRDF